jgi:glycosyltransferase involved in cell wall biosynthesis
MVASVEPLHAAPLVRHQHGELKMKVLHVTPSYYPAKSYGGPVESTHQLALVLAEKNVDVTVLTTDADGANRLQESGETVEYAKGLRVRYCPRSFGDDFSLSLLANLPLEIKDADVVHLTAVYSFTTIPTLFYASVFDKPVVWSPRGSLKHWEGTARTSAKSLWERACFALAPQRTYIHCTSGEEAAATSSRLSENLAENVRVIRNGVNIPPDQVRRPNSKSRILFLGRLHPIKGLEQLIDACGVLQSRGAEFELKIAGEGEAAYVEGLRSRAAPLGSAVMFTGFADGAKKEQLFQESDLLVLPSHSENFGMSAAEALAHGIPVVASKGTPWSGLEEHGCGKWVENTPEHLAVAIMELRDGDLVAAGARGSEWMRRDFSWPGVADSMIQLYAEALRA